RVPFLAESLPQLCALVLETPAPLVSTLRADVPPGRVALVARCLEKPVERRFQNVRELVAALEPFGRVRPQLRSTGNHSSPSPHSPSASTLMVGGPMAGPAPPAASSAGGAHIITNGTSASWSGPKPLAPRPRQWLLGLVLLPLLLVGSLALWLGMSWRQTSGHASDHDAATIAASASVSASASAAPHDPPPPTVTMPTAASASPEPAVSAPTKRPLLPTTSRPLTANDAGARPPQGTATAPPSDPFTPADRK
ncbi:MAG TPA: hypothetical protein VLT33_10275, partial [Labilithrix sp.]|nr:hypothetical protein [Labilithrix sp.]